MGNHDVGRSVGLLAEEAIRNRREGESALDILDRICKPFKGTDAEFEASDPDRPGYQHPKYANYTDPHPEAALGMLMLEAFAPHGIADIERYQPMFDSDNPDEESASEAWWSEVKTPFSQRYNFW